MCEAAKLFEDLKDSLEELRRDGIEFKILYLEASDRTLIRRYNESREVIRFLREALYAGLKKEREMLELLRNNADYIIDTSNMKTAQLWAEIQTSCDIRRKQENLYVQRYVIRI